MQKNEKEKREDECSEYSHHTAVWWWWTTCTAVNLSSVHCTDSSEHHSTVQYGSLHYSIVHNGTQLVLHKSRYSTVNGSVMVVRKFSIRSMHTPPVHHHCLCLRFKEMLFLSSRVQEAEDLSSANFLLFLLEFSIISDAAVIYEGGGETEKWKIPTKQCTDCTLQRMIGKSKLKDRNTNIKIIEI